MNNISSTTGAAPPMPDQRQASSAAQATVPVKAATAATGQPPVAAAAQAAKPQPSAEELQRITGELQRRVSAVAPELSFSVDESSGRPIVKITDPVTKEVIQQIPSEEMLQIDKALDKFQQGLLLNRKA